MVVYSSLFEICENPTSLMYLDVTANIYQMKLDITSISADDKDPSTGVLQVGITFTDSDTWIVAAIVTGKDCEAQDVRAPSSFAVNVTKEGELWTGHAQMYNGVWQQGITGGQQPSCSTQATDDLSMMFNTDFVANNTAAKANVYTTERNLATTAEISVHPLSKMCSDYLVAGAGQADTTAYANPFCNPDATDVAVWNDSCASQSSTVANTAFPGVAVFTTPSAFHTQAVTLPSAL